MGGEEPAFIQEAFESNYIAPLGPMVYAFEREFAEYTGIEHCAAVSSGTSAMPWWNRKNKGIPQGKHLALRVLGVGPGDEVLRKATWLPAQHRQAKVPSALQLQSSDFCGSGFVGSRCLFCFDLRRVGSGMVDCVILLS